jgi:L-lactate dehydrogenase complex protein LldG
MPGEPLPRTSDARLNILARVRRAQVRAQLPEARRDPPGRLAVNPGTAADRRARLLEEFALLGVEAHVEASPEAVLRRVRGLVAGKAILSWDPDKLPYGAGEALRGEKTWFGRDPREDQAKAEIGLTGCEAALAETGSLAVVSGPGRPRSASLLPMTHVALIREADILQGMGEFFERYRQSALLPYLVFITGPSRTADIELSLTLGVHGPGKLIAIVGP